MKFYSQSLGKKSLALTLMAMFGGACASSPVQNDQRYETVSGDDGVVSVTDTVNDEVSIISNEDEESFSDEEFVQILKDFAGKKRLMDIDHKRDGNTIYYFTDKYTYSFQCRSDTKMICIAEEDGPAKRCAELTGSNKKSKVVKLYNRACIPVGLDI